MIRTAVYPTILVCMLPCAVLSQSILWQTTRNELCTGECRLESNKIRITVHQFFADVEEEAVISTYGSVWGGDQSTLEIQGECTLTPGTAIRSVLLWNGNKILKGKLRDHTDADSIYENIVNRKRDPMIIEWIDPNQYRYRIFPVALNGSRKIRVLYTVPLSLGGEGAWFEILTLFTVGASQFPTQVPVEICKGAEVTGDYLLMYNVVRKTCSFGSVYQIPYQANFWYDEWGSQARCPLRLRPVTPAPSSAFTARIASGAASGYYTAVVSEIPDTVKEMILAVERETGSAPQADARVSCGAKSFIADMFGNSYMGVYLKTEAPWDSLIQWNVFDHTGKVVSSYRQSVCPKADSVSAAMLPLVWGAKYSHSAGTGNAGGLFGFVDQQMTLLAIESDSLPAQTALKYAESGVPALLPEEIIIKQDKYPVFPSNDIIFEFSTGTKPASLLPAMGFSISVCDRTLVLEGRNLSNGQVSIALYDLKGRLIGTWTNPVRAASSVRQVLPAGLKGMFLVRVTVSGRSIQKQIVLR